MRWVLLFLIAFFAQFMVGCAETEVQDTAGEYTFEHCYCDCEAWFIKHYGYVTKLNKEWCKSECL